MRLQIRPETEAKLNELAQRIHRDKCELLEEASNLLAYNEWLEQKVNASIAAADRSDIVPDSDVCAWIEDSTRLCPVIAPLNDSYS